MGSEMCIRDSLRTPQVLLETQIVEGSRGILRDLGFQWNFSYIESCLLYTSDAADERSSVDLGGRRIIKKKNTV